MSSISLSRSHNGNMTTVQAGDTTLWFSYETLIGFSNEMLGDVVCENVWSSTTGRHLSSIDGGSSRTREERAIVAARTPRAEFLELVAEHIG